MNTPATEINAKPETETQGETEAEEVTLDAIDKEYFAPSELQEKATPAVAEVLALCEQLNVTAKRNFDPEKDFPDGYGLLIQPITKRQEGGKGNVTVGVAIAAIPDPETVAVAEGGGEFIQKTVLDYLTAKLANSVRPRGDENATSPSIPFSVQDFITSTRGGESMATFRKLAPLFVKALKTKGIKFMSAILLRQVFQSVAFAEDQFPKIPQEQWDMIIDKMIAKAEADSLDTSVLVNWKQTRDQAESISTDVDLSDLGDLA